MNKKKTHDTHSEKVVLVLNQSKEPLSSYGIVSNLIKVRVSQNIDLNAKYVPVRHNESNKTQSKTWLTDSHGMPKCLSINHSEHLLTAGERPTLSFQAITGSKF